MFLPSFGVQNATKSRFSRISQNVIEGEILSDFFSVFKKKKGIIRPYKFRLFVGKREGNFLFSFAGFNFVFADQVLSNLQIVSRQGSAKSRRKNNAGCVYNLFIWEGEWFLHPKTRHIRGLKEPSSFEEEGGHLLRASNAGKIFIRKIHICHQRGVDQLKEY